MNKILKTSLIFLSLVLIVFIYYCFFYVKIEAESVKIAVIYAQNIKKQAIPFQKFEKFFESEKSKIHQSFVEKEKQLRLEFDYIKKMTKQQKDASQKKIEFHEKVNELNSALQVKKEEFLEKIEKNQKTLHENLQKIIEKIIKKYGFNVVLNAEIEQKTLVFYADKRFDITDEIISEFNKLSFPFFTE